MIENIENEKECCGSCDFCMFDKNGNAVRAADNSQNKFGDIISENDEICENYQLRFGIM